MQDPTNQSFSQDRLANNTDADVALGDLDCLRQSLQIVTQQNHVWIAAIRPDLQVQWISGECPLSATNKLGLNDFSPAQRLQLSVDRCLESGTVEQTRLCEFLPNGQTRWWQLELHPSFADALIVLGRDVSEAVLAHERLARLSPRARQLLDLLLLDKPHKEIERLMGISLRSISRVRAELNSTLETTSLVQMAKMVDLAASLISEEEEPASEEGDATSSPPQTSEAPSDSARSPG